MSDTDEDAAEERQAFSSMSLRSASTGGERGAVSGGARGHNTTAPSAARRPSLGSEEIVAGLGRSWEREVSGWGDDAGGSGSGGGGGGSSKPLKKGQLILDEDFEAGNLGSVRAIGEGEFELCLCGDTNAPRFRLWFYFRVRNAKAGQRALFHLTNFSKTRSLYRDGMSPLVASTSRPKWQRLPPKTSFYYRSPKHKHAYVLSFVFVFDKEDDEYAFAYSYPYTYTDQQRFLSNLSRRQFPLFSRRLLCRSVQRRRVDVVTIGDETDCVRPRPVAFISGRVHPGETPASHAVHGLLEFLVSDAPEAAALRKEVTFVVVPMLNPDGCYLGNYRSDSLGSDLNRLWEEPTEEMEPSLWHTRKLLQEYAADERYRLDFYVDVHAHSTCRTGFFLCNPPPDNGDAAAHERLAALPKAMDNLNRDFSVAACRLCTDPTKSGSARRALSRHLPRTLLYTLELSFFANGGAGDTNVGSAYASNDDDYRDFGNNLGLSFYDVYRAWLAERAGAGGAAAAASAAFAAAKPATPAVSSAPPSSQPASSHATPWTSRTISPLEVKLPSRSTNSLVGLLDRETRAAGRNQNATARPQSGGGLGMGGSGVGSSRGGRPESPTAQRARAASGRLGSARRSGGGGSSAGGGSQGERRRVPAIF